MGKNNKGKKRGDPPGAANAVSHASGAAAIDSSFRPSAVVQLEEASPEPKPIRLNEWPAAGHGIQSPNAASPNPPQHDSGWESQGGGDDWGRQEQGAFIKTSWSLISDHCCCRFPVSAHATHVGLAPARHTSAS